MIKIAPTPDEAYEICTKHALNCAIGQSGYWNSGITSSTSFKNTNTFNSLGAVEQSSSLGQGSSTSFSSSTGSSSFSSSVDSFGTGGKTEISLGQTSGFVIRGDDYEAGKS